MNNFICFLLNHKISQGWHEFKHLGCPHWDDCNIEEHQMVEMIYKCERCDFTISKKAHLKQLHPITKYPRSDAE